MGGRKREKTGSEREPAQAPSFSFLFSFFFFFFPSQLTFARLFKSPTAERANPPPSHANPPASRRHVRS